MKKLMMIFSAALAMMVTSCIEHDVTISVNKDGSGTVTEKTTLGGAAVMMMAQMGGEDGDNPFADMADEDAAKETAATMGEGVTVEKVEAIDANGRKGARVTFAFKDINTLKYTFGNSMSDMGEGMAPDEVEEEEDEEEKPMEFSYKDGVLTLVNPGAAKPPAAEEEADAEGEEGDDELDEAGLAMAKQMMGDMKMSFKIEIPGGIVETNATHVDGNTVTFMEMEMGKLLEDPEKFKALSEAQPDSPAEMQELLKGVEGVKVETQEKVTIKLK